MGNHHRKSLCKDASKLCETLWRSLLRFSEAAHRNARRPAFPHVFPVEIRRIDSLADTVRRWKEEPCDVWGRFHEWSWIGCWSYLYHTWSQWSHIRRKTNSARQSKEPLVDRYIHRTMEQIGREMDTISKELKLSSKEWWRWSLPYANYSFQKDVWIFCCRNVSINLDAFINCVLTITRQLKNFGYKNR